MMRHQQQQRKQQRRQPWLATCLALALATAAPLVQAFLPVGPRGVAVSSTSSLMGRQLLSRAAAMPSRVSVSSLQRAGVRLQAAAEGEEEIGPDHEIAEGEDGKPAASANPVDDVFNSVPFLTKRKEAIEKELASIEENMGTLAEQYAALEDEWGDKVAVMKKDYDSLKARYYNDTQEVATTGRSNVFIELMSVVDDFERAKMAYKPATDEEREVLVAYDGVKDAIIQGMMTQGMEEVKTVGEAFDFKMHDCMFTEQSTEYAEDIVTREFSKGFMIGGKVIRPAKVACSLGPGP